MAFFLHKCRWKDSFRWHSNSHSEYLLYAHLHYLRHSSGYRDRVCHCLSVIQLHLQKQKVSLHSSHRAISCDSILLCRIVRLISPNLNYFIILGAILLYISIAFFVFPTLDPFLVTFACHVRLTTFNTLILLWYNATWYFAVPSLDPNARILPVLWYDRCQNVEGLLHFQPSSNTSDKSKTKSKLSINC